MAVLDSRLIPFIEMLTNRGLDWLGFELIDGIRKGRESEETSEALVIAREQVRAGEIKTIQTESIVNAEASPLLGEDQLNWAADYVDKRLAEVISEMSASLSHIDSIVGTVTDEGAGDTISAAIILHVGDTDQVVERTKIEAAKDRLPALRKALESWLTSIKTGLDQ